MALHQSASVIHNHFLGQLHLLKKHAYIFIQWTLILLSCCPERERDTPVNKLATIKIHINLDSSEETVLIYKDPFVVHIPLKLHT